MNDPSLEATILEEMLGPEPWCVDVGCFNDPFIIISGWALAPAGNHGLVSFTVNGRPFDQITYPIPRQEVGKVFWYKKGAAQAGFRCRAQVSPEEAGDECLVLSLASGGPEHLVSRRDLDYYYPSANSPDVGLPFPDVDRVLRITGSDSLNAFRIEGFSILKKIDLALKRHGRSLSEFRSVLDWGCGCGRIGRYLRASRTASLTGVDVDPDNVAWCQRNLGFGDFRVAPLVPPTDLPEGAFDLVYGISVLTHLSEEHQFRWLAELRRLTSDGAFVLLSTHGYRAAARGMRGVETLNQFKTKGVLFDKTHHDRIDNHIGSASYYGTAFTSEGYVRRRWEEYFSVLEVIPGYIGNVQDLVVMRRRP